MDSQNETRRGFVEALAKQNRAFYGTSDGRSMLRALELTFEHRWIYLFELVQNALDAGARSVVLQLMEDGDGLIFQHDGQKSLDEKDVEGLSKIFRSTKGASSVGFMGIGFKSVFGRFREARISGWGWKFRYEVAQVVGEPYGDVQPDLLGAVTPIWDDAIAVPEAGFTTRFEMSQRVDPRLALRSDLTYFLSGDDRTLLAILAAARLERLELDGLVWELGVHEEPDGSLEATARSAGENLLWQLFPVWFKPSRDAIAHFLEHRRIQPTEDERERVYVEAARDRQVLGVLPLDDYGVPAPPKRGRIYATLPTEVTLPFGLHINADWLLNISRTGLREIEENPWQRDIVDQIAEVLASFLRWIAGACSKPDAAKAAFAALALPSAEEGSRLEALLAEKRWLARLRAQLEVAAVLPVFTAPAGALGFAKPSEAIIPPTSLADAFEAEPALLPAILMQGQVLARDVLGSGAHALLAQAGLLQEMAPEDLEQSWAGGLESWWEALSGEESDRRALLFRLWGAVAELASDEVWRSVELPCVRTAGGAWLPVDEAAFFNEALPSAREPGGSETRQLIESCLPDVSSCVPDAWIGALRQGAGRENGPGPFSRARHWLERYGRSIDLRQAIEAAVEALAAAPSPDWAVLVPLGHWVMSRRTRTDLLTHVLVESENGVKGVPISEALVADPYVERGESRRYLFPTMPAISAAYVEQDPKGTDAHEWRGFFERAGVQGPLRIRAVETRVHRYARQHVAEFLGLDLDAVGESNNTGYTLVDFEVEPDLPELGASEELRAALAAWLEDGFSALRGKGHRKVSYSFYGSHERTGSLPSSWVSRLSALVWVPCDDGRLRPPRDVLPHPDPAREGLPVANLAPGLLSALEREGVEFGAAIPEAPALRRLMALGSKTDAEGLADLLRESREQGATTEEAKAHFRQAVAQLTLPAIDGRRVPIERVVHRVGGRLRGALGGWILPLADVHEALRAELIHSDFPYEFPGNTTGEQALAYIRAVWSRARSSPEGLANEVRDVLPAAYAYCCEDIPNNASLSERWAEAVPEAAVFAERAWILLAEATEPVYFDDLEDRRFFPSGADVRTATGGHLGASAAQQRRTARALGLRPLSSVVELAWRETGSSSVTDWVPRFELICELLLRIRGSERMDGREETATESKTELGICRVKELELMVSVDGAAAEPVLVNARLHEGVLIVAGRPIRFASDAAKELLRAFSFRQRGDLAADLTGMLAAIDEASEFALAVGKFVRSFAPGFDLSAEFRAGPGEGRSAGSEDRPGEPEDISGPDKEGEVAEGEADDTSGPGNTGGSFDHNRALARQKALAEKLKKALKGEINLGDEDGDFDETEGSGGDAGGGLGDEVYREVAARYEHLFGREPELGDPLQAGWDLRSVDPQTGSERLIEVKGKGCSWTEDEVVELSRAQVRKAFEAFAAPTTDMWYLYVVERTGEGSFQVLPIENPVRLAGKWLLRGEAWRMVAEEPRQVMIGPTDADAAEESE